MLHAAGLSETTDLDRDIERLEIFIGRVEGEANFSWSRHNYFLLVTSALIVAFTQSPSSFPLNLSQFRGALALAGVATSIIWVLMHQRSSAYVKYYKEQAGLMGDKAKIPNPFPKTIGGVETRLLGFILPLAFLAFWIFLALDVFNVI